MTPEIIEEWRNIPGYADKYQCSNLGRIKSFHRNIIGNILTPSSAHGYKIISLSRDGKWLCKGVHRLVLETFVGSCPEGMEGCHNNGIRSDNRLENLRWDTPKNNIADKKLHGTNVVAIGEQSGPAKLNEKRVRVIKWCLKNGMKQAIIAKYFLVSHVSIFKISTGRSWKHIPNP